MNDPAVAFGLPAGFAPVRLPISDAAKDVLRSLLAPGEPVIITLSNESDTLAIVATPQRVFVVKSGATIAGVTGANVKEFPWEGLTNLKLQPASLNAKIALAFKSNDNGRTCEVGQRARLAKDVVENLMPFESNAASQVFSAMWQIWTHKTGGPRQPVG